MASHSMLHETTQNGSRPEASEAPCFFADLNLDPVIDEITANKQEYDLKPFFYACPHDIDTILYRHAVMQDLESEALLGHIRRFAHEMVVVRRYLALVEKADNRNHREGWFLEAAAVYCEAVSALARDLARANLRSGGFLAFQAHLTSCLGSPAFVSLAAETHRLKADLAAIAYCVTIKGLTV